MTQAQPAPKPAGKPGKTKLKLVSPVKQAAVMDFQSDAIALEERRPPITARMTLYLVAAAIGAGIYWASVSRIDEIVVAPGKLATSEPTLVMQPFETSIIRSINVKPGDLVTKGQLLAALDPTFASSDTGQIQAKLAGFDAQIGRIRAELAGAVYEPGENPSPEARMQAELAAQRRSAYDARLDDFAAQIAHSQAMIDAAADQQAVLGKRIAGLQEIQDMHATLADAGNGSRLTFLQSRDLSLDLQVSLTQVKGAHAEALQQLAQTRAERQNYIEDYRRLALEALVDLEDKRAGAIEELRKVDLRTAMSQIVAPADAAVLEVAQRSVASVVQPAEPLITLVPTNVPLDVEVTVASNDIGHLAIGDLAKVKFDAFPFQEHGTVEGKVTAISENSFARPDGAEVANGPAFYKVRIDLGDQQLRNLPASFRLLPGMTVSAEIHAGEQTVISYFLYPLIRGLDESLREP